MEIPRKILTRKELKEIEGIFPNFHQLVKGNNGSVKTLREIDDKLKDHLCGVGNENCPLKKSW